MKKLIVFIVLSISIYETRAANNADTTKRKYRDITIEIDLLNGTERFLSSKFGEPETTLEITRFKNDKLEINTNHHIYLRLKNYNPLAYKVERRFDNKEYEIPSDAREQFLSAAASLKPVQSTNEKPEDETAEQVNESLKQLNLFDINANISLSNTISNNSVKDNLKPFYTNNKNKLNDLMLLFQNKFPQESFTSSKAPDIIEELLKVLAKRQDSLTAISGRLSLLLNDFNKTCTKLNAYDNLKLNVLQSISNPNLETARSSTTSLFNNYFGATWVDRPEYFNNFSDSITNKLTSTYSKINKECAALYKIEDEIRQVYDAMLTIRTFLGTSFNRQANISMNDAIESFSIFKSDLAEIRKGVEKKQSEAKSQYVVVIEKRWDTLFAELHSLFTDLKNIQSDTFTIQLGQVEKDFSEIELTFLKAVYANGTIKYVENMDLKRAYKFRIKKGVKVSFSTGLGFSNYFQNQSSYVLKDLPFEQVQTGDTTVIQPNDTSIIIEEKGNSFTPLLTSIMHVQFRSSNDLAIGLCLGIGVPLAGTKDVQFLLGSSLILGTEQRFIISFGVSGGKVNKIGGGYQAGEYVPKGMEIPVLKDQYAVGMFLGVSYNIAASK